MPSFWKRIGLAAALTAQISASPTLTFAQQCSTTGTNCSQTPCASAPGSAHVGSTGQAHVGSPSEAPPWVESPSTPTPSPSPMEMTPTPSPSPMDTPPAPMDTPPSPMDTPPSPMDAPPNLSDLTPPGDSLSFASPQAGVGSTDQGFGPNLMGDLLKGFRNVNFPYNGAGDFATVDSAGAATIRNSKVSENNSAVPRDRFSFRYNYFRNANDVDGFRLGGPITTIPGFENFPNEFRTVIPASKSYDAHFFTFGLEKTFADGLGSIEVRVPFASTLDSDLNLIGSRPIRNDILAPRNIPNDGTLGNSDTELQDLSFILKGVLYRSQNNRLLVSAGAGMTIPTGEDANIFVVDTYDDMQGLEPTPEFNTQILGLGNNIRTRDIWVENEIYELSPFLAVAAVPTQNIFFNGFVQLNLPLNSADVRYREQRVDVVARDFTPNATGVNQFGVMFGPNGSEGMFEERAKVKDQMLLQIDVGGGYWLYRNPQANLLTGIASLLELHYTTTLEDANIAAFQAGPPGAELFIQQQGNFEGPTRVGNLANRIDILNATIGGVVELSNTATLAVGYVAPLRDDFDRTFDGELNVQFNLYR